LQGAGALLGPDKPPTDLATRNAPGLGPASPGTGDPGWDPYDTERRAAMRIDAAEWTQVDDPAARERQAWI